MTMGQELLRCKKSVVEDFKGDIGKGLLTTICAFLNTQGGLIYVGYDDKGFPVGLADVNGAVRELRILIQSAFEPTVQKYISWDCFQSDGKSIILIKVTKSESEVSLNDKNDERWYRRVGGSNKLFNKERVNEVLGLGEDLEPRYVVALGRLVEEVVIEDMRDGDIKYWRDEHQIHIF